jgi:hypothetical protein
MSSSPDVKDDILRSDLRGLSHSSTGHNLTLLESLESQSTSSVHVALSSRRLVGTPYCDQCKSYLSNLMEIRKNQHKSNVHHLGLDNSANNLVMSGFLAKQKAGRTLHELLGIRQTRWFVLGDGHLVYYQSPEDFGTTFPNGVVHLEGCRIASEEDQDPQGTEFILEKSNKTKIRLQAATVGEKRVWITTLRQHMRPTNKWSQDQAGPEAGYFCAECDSYLNMDDFTLAEIDGELDKFERKKKVWTRRWVVATRKGGIYTTEHESKICHLAYYASLDDVSRYRPLNIIHVVPDRVSVDAQRPDVLTIQTPDRDYLFRVPNPDQLNDWKNALECK